jgi:hypothetical protein
LGEDYEAFKILCLQESALRPTTYPCSLPTSCAYRIVPSAPSTLDPAPSTLNTQHSTFPSFTGVCLHYPVMCEQIELMPADVIPLEVNWQRLGRALCRALGLDARTAELNLFHTQQIGSWSTDAVPVILTIQTEVYDLRSVIGQLAARLHQKFILLTPTSEFVDVNCKELLAGNGAELFPLDATVTLTAHGTLLPVKLPGELFANFRPDPKDSVSEETARQLLALVKRFDEEHRFRKAPLYLVFLMYCSEGLTVKEIARDCECGRTLVFRRLRLLKKLLGRHPAELRQYFAHFARIEASLSDPRARKIYRKGAINGSEQDDDA